MNTVMKTTLLASSIALLSACATSTDTHHATEHPNIRIGQSTYYQDLVAAWKQEQAEMQAAREAEMEETVVVVEEEPVIEELEAPAAGIPTRDLTAPDEQIEFAFDSASLTASDERYVREWADYINETGTASVTIHGHTDSIGPADYNEQLSARRANSAAELLRSLVNADLQIDQVAHGESQPIASNDTEEGRQQNRRVDITLTE